MNLPESNPKRRIVLRGALTSVQKDLEITRLREQVAEMKPKADIFDAQQQRVAELREKADLLNKYCNIAFQEIPHDLLPGTPVVTSYGILQSGITRYTLQRLEALISEYKLPGYIMPGNTVYYNSDTVEALLIREKKKMQDTSRLSKPGEKLKNT